MTAPTVREAVFADTPSVAEFLGSRLGGEGPPLYRRIFDYRWLVNKPNIGFLIEQDGRIGGFVGGVYSQREIRGTVQSFCNVHSFAVDAPFRMLSLPMLERFLDRPNHTFTSFTATPSVVKILRFFKFQIIDAGRTVFTPVSGIGRLFKGAAQLHCGPNLESKLEPFERAIMRDHAGYRCGHFLLEASGARCYFVTIRRGRDVRAFADVLYANNPQLLIDYIAYAHLPVARTHGTALIGLVGRRFVSSRPAGSFLYSHVSPFAFRSSTLREEDIDMLYSELVPMYA